MSRKSRIIIVGSGIVGASTAYHLAQLGWKDMVILDQGPLFETGGSTSHAPGGVFQTNPSRMMCKFAQYTVDLLRSLNYEEKPCFHTVGGIEVSKTKERHEDLYRKLGIAHSYGLTDAKIISPDDICHNWIIMSSHSMRLITFMFTNAPCSQYRVILTHLHKLRFTRYR